MVPIRRESEGNAPPPPSQCLPQEIAGLINRDCRCGPCSGGGFGVPVDSHDVDGRNPAPVGMVNIPLFTGYYTSQVVQDFFHQPYLLPGCVRSCLGNLFGRTARLQCYTHPS